MAAARPGWGQRRGGLRGASVPSRGARRLLAALLMALLPARPLGAAARRPPAGPPREPCGRTAAGVRRGRRGREPLLRGLGKEPRRRAPGPWGLRGTPEWWPQVVWQPGVQPSSQAGPISFAPGGPCGARSCG